MHHSSDNICFTPGKNKKLSSYYKFVNILYRYLYFSTLILRQFGFNLYIKLSRTELVYYTFFITRTELV